MSSTERATSYTPFEVDRAQRLSNALNLRFEMSGMQVHFDYLKKKEGLDSEPVVRLVDQVIMTTIDELERPYQQNPETGILEKMRNPRGIELVKDIIASHQEKQARRGH